VRAGSPRSDCPHCPERSCCPKRSCCPRRVSRGRKRRFSVERFLRPIAVSLLISTVSVKRLEEQSGNVPECAGMRISTVFNSYRSISQNRSKSVPEVRGTLKSLITIVLRDHNHRFWTETKKTVRHCLTAPLNTVVSVKYLICASAFRCQRSNSRLDCGRSIVYHRCNAVSP